MGNAHIAAVAEGGGNWPPPPREALPPFPSPTNDQPGDPQAGCWTYSSFDSTLPFTPPSQPDIDFYRGNVMGTRQPGLPQVYGNCDDPSFIVTWFHYQYMWQNADELMLDALVERGQTHINHHRAAWMGRLNDEGVPGCSREWALESVRRCAARIPFNAVNLAIDNGPPDPDELKSWIDDLIAAGMNIGVLAWQIDHRIPNPIDLCDYIAWCAPYLRERGCKVATHWVLHGCAVYDAATCEKYGVCDRFTFQEFCNRMGVNHVLEQFDVNAPVLDTRPHEGGIIGEAGDMLKSLVGDMKLVAAEFDMQAEFDAPYQRLEIYGDLKGRSLMTATAHSRTMAGSFNGNRNTDGSVL